MNTISRVLNHQSKHVVGERSKNSSTLQVTWKCAFLDRLLFFSGKLQSPLQSDFRKLYKEAF